MSPSTIAPNPTEGIYKYTVVTSGRPAVDTCPNMFINDLPLPHLDFYRKNNQGDPRVKRQLPKVPSCGTPYAKSKELKVNTFKKPSVLPLDPTCLANYSPRSTTFVNGRPCSANSPQHQDAPPPAASQPAAPSHPSPDSIRADGSANSYDEQEDAASVDSAHSLRFMNPRPKDPSSYLQPLATSRTLPPAPYSRDYSREFTLCDVSRNFSRDFPSSSRFPASDENLDLCLEQFFPELQSLSDSELLRLMDPTAPLPQLPSRPATLAILQDMLMTQGSFGRGPSHSSPSNNSSNPPSSNWSIASDDPHHSANWSDAPSRSSWRSPRASSPGPANWLSWHNATASRSRKRQHSFDSHEDHPEWAELPPTLSTDLPVAKRPYLPSHRPARQASIPDSDPLGHSSNRDLGLGLLRSVPSTTNSSQPARDPRPNPFASVSKHTLLQPARSALCNLELPSYLSATSPLDTPAAHHPQACSVQAATGSTESVEALEPATVLEQALRELRSRPEPHVA